MKDIELLVESGLIRGGGLDNAIVIYDKPVEQPFFDKLAYLMNIERKDIPQLGYKMNEPLRFSNEPARHKILDIIGDISLIGKFIKGTIISTRSGHKANNMLARLIREEIKKEELSNVTVANQSELSADIYYPGAQN